MPALVNIVPATEACCKVAAVITKSMKKLSYLSTARRSRKLYDLGNGKKSDIVA